MLRKFNSQSMSVIRVTPEDKKRIDFMRGLVSVSKFMTVILDKYEQPKKQGNPQLKDKKTNPNFQRMKDHYVFYWKKYNGFEYRWNGLIDATALNRLIKTLEGMTEGSDVAEPFLYILEKLPKFYHDKTINAINKNINQILAEIKNGSKGKQDFASSWDNLPDHLNWRK